MEAVLTNSSNNVVLEVYWKMLSTLSRTVRLGLASRLTDSILKEELSGQTSAPRKIAKVKRMPIDKTDAELEAEFADKPMPELPVGDAPWQDVIKANSGRTIKPVEKWV